MNSGSNSTLHRPLARSGHGGAPSNGAGDRDDMVVTEKRNKQKLLGRRTRKLLLSVHIAVSVGLLGDSAGFLAVALRAASSHDPAFVAAAHKLLGTFALYFGIPLSFLALLTGLALGLGTPWGVFRYPWVITKLGLILSVIVVGATLLRPVLHDTSAINHARLILGSAWDVVALATATGLSVFKPGRRLKHR